MRKSYLPNLSLAVLFYFGVYKKVAPKPLEQTLSQKLSSFPAP